MSVINKTISPFEQSRRQFITKILPTTALCFGCSNLLSFAYAEENPAVPIVKHKFIENSGMSYKEVFDFAFKEFYIPQMKGLQNQVGKDKFIEILKKSSSEYGTQDGQNQAQSLGRNDIYALASAMKNYEMYKHVLTYEIVEETARAYEVKISECLWAKTFRENDASDIGYASLCYSDYSFAPGFNPDMKMIRTKTLMQGDSYCNHRYVIEA